jgi:glycosyl-4,4'-diaponeurosporenoate acyltransferase
MEGAHRPDPAVTSAPLWTSALGWLGWCLLVGGLANALPLNVLSHDGWLTRPRPWGERTGSYERRLAIRRWKPLLPDAGGVLPGGVAKAALVRRDRSSLERLLAETRRAELVHLALWPFWLVTALWLPPRGVLINLIFATAFNLPCLWLQRYSRLRLLQILAGPPPQPSQPATGHPLRPPEPSP